MTTLTLTNFDPIKDQRYRAARAAPDVAAWLAYLDLENKAPRTIDIYERTAAHLLMRYPKNELADFTDGQLSEHLRHYPRGSYRARRGHLAALFRWAKLTRRITDNPLDLVPMPRAPKSKIPDVFTEAEEALLCALPSPDGELATILFETGIRKGEAMRLQRRHVSLDRMQLFVYQGKGGKDRIVPLTMRAAQAVVDLERLEGLNPEDYFWYRTPGGRGKRDHSKPLGDDTFHRWWGGTPQGRRGIVQKAGVTYRKPHMTRHTYATRWRHRGLDLDEIQQLLGHASISTTSDLYVHTTISDVARRMSEIEGLA